MHTLLDSGYADAAECEDFDNPDVADVMALIDFKVCFVAELGGE